MSAEEPIDHVTHYEDDLPFPYRWGQARNGWMSAREVHRRRREVRRRYFRAAGVIADDDDDGERDYERSIEDTIEEVEIDQQ